MERPYNAFALLYRLGVRIAAWVGSYGTAAFGTDDFPQPAAGIVQYTGLSEYSRSGPATFVAVRESEEQISEAQITDMSESMGKGISPLMVYIVTIS